jgi:hypothetical protein
MKKLLFLFAIAAFLGACEKDDPPAEFQADPAADAGTLLIINNSKKRLVLYKDEVPQKKITSSSSDYLVNLPTTDGEAVELSLYDWEDVQGDINNPPLELVFKKWKVSLANSTAVSDQATWHVSASSQYSTMATILFNYYAGTENHVDVFLDGQTGAKLMTLKPGQQYRKIGLDYGNHTLAYHYWLSDQNTADASNEIGWIEKQSINGKEGNIWLVLNENRSEMTMVVPHYGSDISNIKVKYGTLKVFNNTGDPVQIYANGDLIEYECYLEEGSPKNLSTIYAGDNYPFVMPVSDGEEEVDSVSYNIKALHLTNGNTLKSEEVYVKVGETLNWVVE